MNKTQKNENVKFQDFMERKNDEIDNAAYHLLSLLANTSIDGDCVDGNILDWDMHMIGELIEEAARILRDQKYVQACWPYRNDEDSPCPYDGDCDRKDCKFRK